MIEPFPGIAWKRLFEPGDIIGGGVNSYKVTWFQPMVSNKGINPSPSFVHRFFELP